MNAHPRVTHPRVALGVDWREEVAFHVATSAILRRASQPVTFLPIALNTLKASFDRPPSSTAATQFSFSRFLAPWLVDYEGWVLFMDSDTLMRADIAELWALRDDRYAVMCVKHDHRPTNAVKFLDAPQTVYEKKNWSSVMLMNAARCRALTPDYVQSASGLELHRFRWLEDESLIGDLPPEWNHLVGWSDGALEDQKLLHWTEGGPWISAYGETKWADVWRAERDRALTVVEERLTP